MATLLTFGFDRDYQGKVVRLLFQDEAFTDQVAPYIDVKLFDNPQHRWFIRAILAAHHKYGAPSNDSIKLELESALRIGSVRPEQEDAYRQFLDKLHKPVSDKYVIRDGLTTFIRRQRLKTGMEEALGFMEREDINKAETSMREVLNDSLTDFKRGVAYFDDLKRRLLKRKEEPVKGVPTGIGVDMFMRTKGLPPKKLGCITAPPGIGKTATLITFGANAIRNGHWPVVHLSCEIDRDEMMERYDAAVSGVTLDKLTENQKIVYAAVKALKEKSGGNALIVEEYGSQELTNDEIDSFMRRLSHKGIYPKLLIVDYLNEMQSDNPEDTFRGQGDIARKLRRTASMFDVPVWTASQGNRASVTKTTVGMGDTAGSMLIPAVVDIQVTISQTMEEKAKHVARFFLAKNRFGPSSVSANVHTDFARQTVR